VVTPDSPFLRGRVRIHLGKMGRDYGAHLFRDGGRWKVRERKEDDARVEMFPFLVLVIFWFSVYTTHKILHGGVATEQWR